MFKRRLCPVTMLVCASRFMKDPEPFWHFWSLFRSLIRLRIKRYLTCMCLPARLEQLIDVCMPWESKLATLFCARAWSSNASKPVVKFEVCSEFYRTKVRLSGMVSCRPISLWSKHCRKLVLSNVGKLFKKLYIQSSRKTEKIFLNELYISGRC